jgi:predicted nucleic acid-binding protein
VAKALKRLVAVIDANVLYARKKREAIIEAIRQDRLDGVWSPHIVGELYRILTVRWLQKRGADEASLRELSRSSKALMELLVEVLQIVDTGPQEYEELPDPDDFHLIRAARLSNAGFVVSENTGDFPAIGSDGRHVYDGVEYLTYDALLSRLGVEEKALLKERHAEKTE